MPVCFLILFLSPSANAFLDFIGTEAKKAVEVAAYVDAAAELAGEVAPDKDLEVGAKDLQMRAEALRSQASNVNYLTRTTQQLLKGPDWTSKRMDTNIRNTTDYIRRLKRLIVRAVALGTEGTIALNTTETNIALNEVQKNQQAMIMQNSDAQLREIEREQEEGKQWTMFSEQQRKLRSKEVTNGKL